MGKICPLQMAAQFLYSPIFSKLLHFSPLSARWNIRNELPLHEEKEKAWFWFWHMQLHYECTTFHLLSPYSSMSIWQISKACWFQRKQRLAPKTATYLSSRPTKWLKKWQKDSHSYTQTADCIKETATTDRGCKRSERGHDVKEKECQWWNSVFSSKCTVTNYSSNTFFSWSQGNFLSFWHVLSVEQKRVNHCWLKMFSCEGEIVFKMKRAVSFI